MSGSIPATIGQLPGLNHLDLRDNNFSGEIPDMVGRMGGVPGLSTYSSFRVSGNPRLTGMLPRGLSNAVEPRNFEYAGTGLCAPDEEFQAWVENIEPELEARHFPPVISNVSYNLEGCDHLVSTEPVDAEKVFTFRLNQNYPNPLYAGMDD